uniref:Uncharacterized protein n=1 Tax=Anopheles minimus TaxID=112268 RepID=A0A182WPA1_9DIPT
MQTENNNNNTNNKTNGNNNNSYLVETRLCDCEKRPTRKRFPYFMKSLIVQKLHQTDSRMTLTTRLLLSALTCVAVLFCNLPLSSAAALKKINVKETEHGSSEIEPLVQEAFATYDQRQSGQYNIKVNIKDVKIIYADRDGLEGSLDDDTIYDYGEYDYDPSHLTVSPLPIFGSGSISFTTSKPPKLSTKVSTTTVKYGTKYTTEKPQRVTTVVSPSTMPHLSSSTTESPTTTQAATIPMVQNQSLETNTSNGILSNANSTLVSEETHFTTESIKTTIKPSHNGNPVKVQKLPPAGHYNYENIPVQVISDPFYKRNY